MTPDSGGRQRAGKAMPLMLPVEMSQIEEGAEGLDQDDDEDTQKRNHAEDQSSHSEQPAPRPWGIGAHVRDVHDPSSRWPADPGRLVTV